MKNNSSDNSNHLLKFIAAIAGEIVLILFLFLFTRFLDKSLDIKFWFHELTCELIVYGATLIMLLITGLLPDFFRSFTYGLKQPETISAVQVKKSILSVKLAMTTTVIVNLFVLIYSYVSLLANLHTVSAPAEESLPASLALLGGESIYGILAVIVLLPVYARLKKRLISL